MRLKPAPARGTKRAWRAVQYYVPRLTVLFVAIYLASALVKWILPTSVQPTTTPPPPPPAAAIIEQPQQQNYPPPVLEYFSSFDCSEEGSLVRKFAMSNTDPPGFQEEAYVEGAVAVRLSPGGGGRAEFHYHGRYVSTLFAADGCVRVFHYPAVSTVRLYPYTAPARQISEEALLMQRRQLNNNNNNADVSSPAKYRVVFSAQSSEYFGYQVWANKLAFLQSQRGEDATWTRLLTCQRPDDLAADLRFPTFTAPAHPYAVRYSPLNKPDVLEKWFASPDAPQEDVIVVIDPDSWLLLPLFKDYVAKVTPGSAIGQAAYYAGTGLPQVLWRELCEQNCDQNMDLVGVPYIVHRHDLAKLAPLWKHYVLKIKYATERSTPGAQLFSQKYGALDVNWASEMYGYNMASTHLGIAHQVVYDLQVRDVDGSRTFEHNARKASVHVGRAWFPRGSQEAKPYLHTEGKSFSFYGDQVWCKCNFTASTVKPWPLPSNTDFQSYHTLRLLHESEQEFGPVPDNEEWRHKLGDLKDAYKWTHP